MSDLANYTMPRIHQNNEIWKLHNRPINNQNEPSSVDVITRHHTNGNTSPLALGNSSRHFGAHRILDADKGNERQFGLKLVEGHALEVILRIGNLCKKKKKTNKQFFQTLTAIVIAHSNLLVLHRDNKYKACEVQFWSIGK
jgi:hypothetical protein